MHKLTITAAGLPLPKAVSANVPVVFIIDDDIAIREAVCELLENDGHTVETYPTCEEFLRSYHPGRGGCLLVDANLPGLNGLELLQQLREAGDLMPAIIFTGHSDVPMVVKAMKAGAFDFIEEPIGCRALLASIELALAQSRDLDRQAALHETAACLIAGLTERQHQIMALVLAGSRSKNIAADLGISQRTVENHRAAIMKKTGSKSVPALARMAFGAASTSAAAWG
jgi:two-component system, chemotaxis family, CheB/CheR fusion protein